MNKFLVHKTCLFVSPFRLPSWTGAVFLRFSDETGPVRGVRQVEASASRVSRFHLPEKKKKKRKKKTAKKWHMFCKLHSTGYPF